MLGDPCNNNGRPRSIGNPAREKGSCHALATLVSICMVSSFFSLFSLFMLFGILAFPRYLLEVVTFVAVIVVSMVCGDLAKITVFILHKNSDEACDIGVMLTQ